MEINSNTGFFLEKVWFYQADTSKLQEVLI